MLADFQIITCSMFTCSTSKSFLIVIHLKKRKHLHNLAMHNSELETCKEFTSQLIQAREGALKFYF